MARLRLPLLTAELVAVLEQMAVSPDGRYLATNESADLQYSQRWHSRPVLPQPFRITINGFYYYVET